MIAIPASLGFFFNTMFNVIDTFFAGLVSTEALAALSINFPIFFLILAFMNGISTGGSTLISNALGEKRPKDAKRISSQIITFACFVYLIVMPLGIYSSPYLFRLLGAEAQYLELALSFMDVIFYGSLFFLLTYAINSTLLAHGDSKTLRNFLIFGFFLNTLLDPWFLWGGFGLPAMGLPGIAFATVLVMIVGTTYVGYRVHQGKYLEGSQWQDFFPRWKDFKEIAHQCLPASLNMMMIGTGLFVITYYVKYFGQAAVAAYGITIRIEQLALLPSIGLTIALLSITGQNNGAGHIHRIKETISITMKYGIIMMLTGAALMLAIPDLLMRLFTQDEAVIDFGRTYLRFAACTSCGYLILAIYVSAMQGMKRPYFALCVNFIRQILIPIIILHFVVIVWKFPITGIWLTTFTVVWVSVFFSSLYIRYVFRNLETKPR